MSNKRSSKTNNNTNIDYKEKYSRFAFFALSFLVVEIFICLVCGWLSGNTQISKISDNYVTALLQNYNYILGVLCLAPIVLSLYRKIRQILINKYISEDKLLLYGFLSAIVVFVSIITVCKVTYSINASTYYGSNSAITVCLFLCPVVILILESIVYGVLTIPNLIKNKEFWSLVRKNAPIILMVMFLIWTFISCMLAPGAADDVIGADKAESVGASPSDVLAKTLNGCYNLKDGFWAFLMYGSVMLLAMFIGKDKIIEKKLLIKIFVVVMMLLSILTLSVSAYENYLYNNYEKEFEVYSNSSLKESNDNKLSLDDIHKYAESQAYKTEMRWYIFPQRAIFRNSNHFAYVLCIALMAACVLSFTEKNIYEKLLYIISFIILTCMLIVNDTFGGYLGVLISLIVFIIFGVMRIFLQLKNSKNADSSEKKNIRMSLLNNILIFSILIASFVLLSINIKDSNNNIIVTRNFKTFFNDVGFFNSLPSSGTINNDETIDSDVESQLSNVGSGRGIVWVKSLDLVKQRPLFGYGLECLLFQFNGQFDVNEGRTHNLLLQLLATVGIPGTLMYFTALGIIFVRLIKNWKTWNDVEKICVFVGIAYMITALTGNSSYYTSPYFMMFLGFVVLTPWKREN